MKKKISIMLAALSILSVSAVCPANTAITSITTKTVQADTFTIGVAKRSTPIKQSASSSAKTIKTLSKGSQVQIFRNKNGYYYVGYGNYEGLGWVKTSDLDVHTCYR